MKWLGWFHNDGVLRVAAGVVALAVAVKQATPDHTVANKVATVVIELGAALGVASTVGRERKES